MRFLNAVTGPRLSFVLRTEALADAAKNATESASKWQPSPRQRLPMDQPEPEGTSIKPTGSIILDDGSIVDGRDKNGSVPKVPQKEEVIVSSWE